VTVPDEWEHEQDWAERRIALLTRIGWIIDTSTALLSGIADVMAARDVGVVIASAEAIREMVNHLDYHRITGTADTAGLRRRLGNLEGYADEVARNGAGLDPAQRLALSRVAAVARDKILPQFEALSSLPPGTAAEAWSSRPEPVGARVLVVDDNDEVRKGYERFLLGMGHKPEAAAGGDEVLNVLRDRSDTSRPLVELVLLDLRMPRPNGAQVLAQVRQDKDPALRDVPVFLLTDDENDPLIIDAARCGVQDIWPKGPHAHPQLLRTRIQNVLRQVRLEAKYRRLLTDVLPACVVEEYVRDDRVEPVARERVAVLFADISGFTAFSHGQSARRVVDCLEKVFVGWDDIAEKHDVQKIKTIGDSFMAVAGLLSDDPDPVRNCVECGGRMVQLLANEPELNPAGWQVRVGIHVGPVVAGLLGRRRFVYDLWGATVNKAARIEHHGRVGMVNLSQEARDEVDRWYDGWETWEEEMKGLGPTPIHALNPMPLKRKAYPASAG
jgi:adenylate cyclase